MKIGIVGAMPQEIELLRDKMQHVVRETMGNCVIYQGSIDGIDVALLQSGIGKTASAMGTTALLMSAKPDVVINTGSAGGLVNSLTVGDIIVSTETCYHDVDVRAFGYQLGQLPGCPERFLSSEALVNVAEEVLAAQELHAVRGLICSGDLFCNSQQAIDNIKANFPDVVAVEMEATAIAQVCHSCDVPFLVVRAVSDIADQESDLSFEEFLPLAAEKSAKMILQMLPKLNALSL